MSDTAIIIFKIRNLSNLKQQEKGFQVRISLFWLSMSSLSSSRKLPKYSTKFNVYIFNKTDNYKNVLHFRVLINPHKKER